MRNFATDVICKCAFGLKLNAINDKYSAFRKYGRVLFTPSLIPYFRELCLTVSTNSLKIVRFQKVNFSESGDWLLYYAFNETIPYGENNNIARNDFVHNLIHTRRDLILNDNLVSNSKIKFIIINK